MQAQVIKFMSISPFLGSIRAGYIHFRSKYTVYATNASQTSKHSVLNHNLSKNKSPQKSMFSCITLCYRLSHDREIHPLDPQPHRYCMLASTASAPRVTRYSLGLYWSRDLFSKHALAGWGMSSFLGQIVRGIEI